MKRLISLLTLTLISLSMRGQSDIDSLKSLIRDASEIQQELKMRYKLSKLYAEYDSTSGEFEQLGEIEKLAEEHNNIYYLFKSYYDQCYEYGERGLKDKSIEYAYKAMRRAEELNRDSLLVDAYELLGLANYFASNFKESLKYSLVSLEMELDKEPVDSFQLTRKYMNLGALYSAFPNGDIKDLDTARSYLLQAVDLFTSLDMKDELANVYVNLSGMAHTRARYDSAMYDEHIKESFDYLFKAKEIYSSRNVRDRLDAIYTKIGKLYYEVGDYPNAKDYLNEGIKYGKIKNNRFVLKQAYDHIRYIYELEGNVDSAYHYRELWVTVNNEIMDEEKVRAITDMQLKYETEKKEKENELLRKNERISKLKLKSEQHRSEQRKFYLIASLGGAFLLIGLAFLLFRGKRIQEKANRALTIANDEIQKQKDEIEKQKDEISEKNQSITDSITYAKRLQEAILPTDKVISEAFSDHFVYFRPRDIVSGDFYWMTQHNDSYYYAAADCTGHGVPGAFVSIVCSNILHNVIVEQGETDPGKILTKTHKGIVGIYKKEGRLGQANDGMDVTLCKWTPGTGNVEYAGAMNSLYMVRDQELQEFSADRRGLGGIAPVDFDFNTTKIQAQPNDVFYMSSDGYYDQFGGSKGKKFKKKRFKELLAKISQLPLEEQSSKLHQNLITWMGEYEQIDDVLVTGFKV